MSEHDLLMARVAIRNPVPDPLDAPTGAVDVDTVRRILLRTETNMLTKQRPTSTEPPRRRGMWLAAGAFVVVLVVGVGLASLLDDGPTPTTTPPGSPTTTTEATTTTPPPSTAPTVATTALPTAVERAEVFVDSMFGGEAEAFEALLDPQADMTSTRYIRDFWAGLSISLVSRSCEPLGSSSNAARCEATFTDDITQVFSEGFIKESHEVQFTDAGVRVYGISPDPNDPAGEWLASFYESSQLLEDGAACEGIFAAGPTPTECAQAMVAEAKQYVEGFVIPQAEAWVAAFYGGDVATLAESADPTTDTGFATYLSGIGVGAHVTVLQQSCGMNAFQPMSAICTMTVSDDIVDQFGEPLTETWHLRFTDSGWRAAEWNGDSTHPFWPWTTSLVDRRPDLMEDGAACEGYLDGGPTPEDCGRALVADAATWIAEND